MKHRVWIIGLCGCFLAACTTAPTKPNFNKLPVITFGQAIAKNKDYILYFPANAPITTNVSIEGNLLQQSAKDTLIVKLNRDIYAYKNWLSFDKQHWSIAHDVLTIHTLVRIPSSQHPEPGLLKVSVSKKQNKGE